MVDVIGGAAASSLIGQIATLADIYPFLGISTPTADETTILTQALRLAEGAVIKYLKYNPVLALQTEFYPQMDFAQQSSGSEIWEVDSTSAHVRRLASQVAEELQVRRLPVRQFDELGASPIDCRIDFDGRSGTRSGSFASETQKTEGDDFWPNYDLTDSNGYLVCSDGIIRALGAWPSTPNSVKFTYMAGYTAEELQGTDTVIDVSAIYDSVVMETVRKFKQAWSRRVTLAGHGVGSLSSESLGDYSYSADGASLQQLTGSSAELLPETAQKLEEYVNYGAMIAM